MRISNTAAAPHQHVMFDRPIASWAQTRNECGVLMEELTAAVTGGVRLRTDGTADYCADVRVADGVYVECKSVGRNGQAIIYDNRLAKDVELVSETGLRLFYWFWRHETAVDQISVVTELRRKVVASIRHGILLPLDDVVGIARTRPVKVLNRNYTGGGSELGYGNRSKGYGTGYSIPMGQLIRAATVRSMSPKVTLPDGLVCGPYRVYTSGRCTGCFSGAHSLDWM